MSSVVGVFTGRKAQKAQSRAADRASSMQQQQFDATREDMNKRQAEWISGANTLSEGYNPYIQGGLQATQQQQALSGALGQDAQRQAYSQYQESPGVAFQREQGMRGIGQNLSAMGVGGGTRLKELSRFNQGLAAQDFNNYYNRLGDQSSQGANALNNQIATRTAALSGGVDTARNIGSFGQQNALQRGSLEVAKGQAVADRWNNMGGQIVGAVTDVATMGSGIGSALGAAKSMSGFSPYG